MILTFFTKKIFLFYTLYIQMVYTSLQLFCFAVIIKTNYPVLCVIKQRFYCNETLVLCVMKQKFHCNETIALCVICLVDCANQMFCVVALGGWLGVFLIIAI